MRMRPFSIRKLGDPGGLDERGNIDMGVALAGQNEPMSGLWRISSFVALQIANLQVFSVRRGVSRAVLQVKYLIAR
jgi:hypothetical protein